MREEAYRAALRKCAIRYRLLAMSATGNKDLIDFSREFRLKIDEGYPIPKLCRWLGYIQGVLIERGITTVEAERDWTRPLFKPLDFEGETNG